jgi:hypothetical protein
MKEMTMTILPLITGSSTATCTICDSHAERAVVTPDAFEALCLTCAKSAAAFVAEGLTDWFNVADRIRSEMAAQDEDDGEEGMPDLDESMDGDHASGLASAGLGTDEDYNGWGAADYGD